MQLWFCRLEFRQHNCCESEGITLDLPFLTNSWCFTRFANRETKERRLTPSTRCRISDPAPAFENGKHPYHFFSFSHFLVSPVHPRQTTERPCERLLLLAQTETGRFSKPNSVGSRNQIAWRRSGYISERFEIHSQKLSLSFISHSSPHIPFSVVPTIPPLNPLWAQSHHKNLLNATYLIENQNIIVKLNQLVRFLFCLAKALVKGAVVPQICDMHSYESKATMLQPQ